jgi:hypothetical protein
MTPTVDRVRSYDDVKGCKRGRRRLQTQHGTAHLLPWGLVADLTAG